MIQKEEYGGYHEASDLARSARHFGRTRACRRLLQPRRLWRWLLWRRGDGRGHHPARDPSRPPPPPHRDHRPWHYRGGWGGAHLRGGGGGWPPPRAPRGGGGGGRHAP